MIADPEYQYRAVVTRDARFDGQFVTAVRTTGIYCRPACPARTPMRKNVDFYPTAAAAQAAGFRACRRCLPDAAPGSPEWNLRADTVGAAMRLIGDGVVDREGVPGLARRLGYTPRHLGRMMTAEIGASPLALARARRAHTARVLLDRDQPADRRHRLCRRLFQRPAVQRHGPRGVRHRPERAARPAPPAAGSARPARACGCRSGRRSRPIPLLAFLAARAVPGVEEVQGRTYSRTLRLPAGTGTVRLTLPKQDDHPVVTAVLLLQQLSDLAPAVDRCRRLLDADADPVGIDQALAADPVLAPSVRAAPGLRVPGAVDGPEILLRALLGQQVSVAAARTAATPADHRRSTTDWPNPTVS